MAEVNNKNTTIVENKYFNRELSWLQFNARVLQEADDKKIPLLERLRFIGIFSNNLDEFFMIRYATIKRIQESGRSGKSVLGGITAKDLMERITKIVIDQQAYSLKILEDIRQELKKENIFIINENDIKKDQEEFVTDYFTRVVSPALMTLMIGEDAELPELGDSAVYLVVTMIMKKEDETFDNKRNYALIEIPKILNRFVVLPKQDDKQYVMIIDDLIRYNLHSIFSGFNYESLDSHMIKITRDAELDLDSDLSRSFVEKISKGVAQRSSGEPVRFVYDKTIDPKTLAFLLNKMDIDSDDSIIPGGRYHNRRDYMNFPRLGRSDLQFEKKEPLAIPGLRLSGSIFEKIRTRDYLLHTPYQSFMYVVKFLREAALDPKVKSIRITIYRLAEVSHIINSLINAKKNGKDVIVQIELRARFDESANIEYAEMLQREKIRVIFGIKGLKVHSKICVVERIENKSIVRYGFVSTGNLNEDTARLYTDYTLFTANQKICKEINKVFEFFMVPYRVRKYNHLIVSPHYTRKAFINLISQEIKNKKAGLPSGIRLKMNSLEDFKLIDKLYEASRAGVKIKLIVRGICSLIPGVPGMSENIEAISIVGKFLEHTRLFIFENAGNPRVYISSADFMMRNLDHRVEVSCPIYDENIKNELIDNFELGWRDNVKARVFNSKNDNAYRRNEKSPVRSQYKMHDYYVNQLEIK